MNDLALDVHSLAVHYGKFEALKSVNLSVHRGQIAGILGPNGAGKSTLVDAIVGAHRKAAGVIRTLGCDPVKEAAALRPRLGVVLQSAGFPPGLKVKDIVNSWRRYTPTVTVDEVRALIRDVEITRFMNRPLASLSGGELRRVDITLALIGSPELLILDEPTTGLDPTSRQRVWSVIQHQRERGATVLLTSHYLEEIEALCDQVFVLRGGVISASGTPGELARSIPAPRRCSFRLAAGQKASELALHFETQLQESNDGYWVWSTSTPAKDVQELMSLARQAGLEVTDLTVASATLQGAYATLVGTDKESSRQ
jgi:ABC transporter, ATP-binding protein